MKSPKKPDIHTLETANKAIKDKGLDSFVKVVEIDPILSTIKVLDSCYGEYTTDIKSLSPKTKFPIHKKRRHEHKALVARDKFIGTTIRELTIIDVFYGPERGYKNKGFYLEYKGTCGHTGIASYALLSKHKKHFVCRSCSMTIHGERAKLDGELKKRTPVYIQWVRVKSKLPEEYKDFAYFRSVVGEKPYNKAMLSIIDEKPTWVITQLDSDRELHLIATALRQAFRYSSAYINCIESARIETEEGPRWRCAACKELFRRKDVQVDHVYPIMDIEGNKLTKQNVIERVWTDKIQVLDRKCHSKKSTEENRIRRQNKKG